MSFLISIEWAMRKMTCCAVCGTVGVLYDFLFSHPILRSTKQPNEMDSFEMKLNSDTRFSLDNLRFSMFFFFSCTFHETNENPLQCTSNCNGKHAINTLQIKLNIWFFFYLLCAILVAHWSTNEWEKINDKMIFHKNKKNDNQMMRTANDQTQPVD